MSTIDEYQKALAAVDDAIRAALDLLTKIDPEKYALSREKCLVERQLRAAGHSRREARRIVHDTFKIHKLGDNAK